MTGTYISDFSGRYASPQMRSLFSEEEKHTSFRRIWYALAKAQHDVAGLGTQEQLDDLYAHIVPTEKELEEIRDIDREIKHDVTAALRVYNKSATLGGPLAHRGGTSRDIQDNAETLRTLQASDIVITRLVNTLESLAPHIKEQADKPCISWTHYQPAGVITTGYRLANYAQGLLIGLEFLESAKGFMKGKGVKGIDGASAGYKMLLGEKATPQEMEEVFAKELGLEVFPVTTQVYPRVVDYITLGALSVIAAVSDKFAGDIRILASPAFSEMGKEPEEKKVGSSDAPWKIYNQTNAERINALGALIAALPQTAWANAAYDPLEGAVHDSANRRVILPEGFLAADELLMNYDYISKNLGFWEGRERNLRNYGAFMGLRELILEASKKGANRTELHERLTNQYQRRAWAEFRATGANPLPRLVRDDERVKQYLSAEEIDRIMDPSTDPKKHTGDAEKKTKNFLDEKLNPKLEIYNDRKGNHVFPEF